MPTSRTCNWKLINLGGFPIQYLAESLSQNIYNLGKLTVCTPKFVQAAPGRTGLGVEVVREHKARISICYCITIEIFLFAYHIATSYTHKMKSSLLELTKPGAYNLLTTIAMLLNIRGRAYGTKLKTCFL